jgi:ankyrin repeat protein
MHVASGGAQQDVIKYLISRGANIDAVDSVCLPYLLFPFQPCFNPLHHQYSSILQHGDTPLHWSARHGHAGSVQLLAANMADTCDVRNACGETPLHLAVRYGHHGVVFTLMTRCDVNAVDSVSSSGSVSCTFIHMVFSAQRDRPPHGRLAWSRTDYATAVLARGACQSMHP